MFVGNPSIETANFAKQFRAMLDQAGYKAGNITDPLDFAPGITRVPNLIITGSNESGVHIISSPKSGINVRPYGISIQQALYAINLPAPGMEVDGHDALLGNGNIAILITDRL